MAIRGEELHVAVWPGWWSMDVHLGAKRPEPGSRGCDVEPAVRAHAIENSVFVVSSSWYLPPAEIPAELQDVMKYNLAVGGSCIVNPSGLFTREPVFEQETIVWAEIDQSERRLAKAYFDSIGHYARWDLMQLVIREEGWEPARAPEPSPARLREAAERCEVRLERLEALVSEIARKGFDPKLVLEIASRIDRAEYKRRQAPIGLKISGKSFGLGRRLPVARGSWR